MAAALVAAIGYGLIVGLDVRLVPRIVEELQVVTVLPPAPPPERDPVPLPKQAQKRKEGTASPPNLTAKATQLVAPVPVIRPPVPSPVVVATVAGRGGDPSAGAAPVVGPGTGSGGSGNGTGSGDGGDGDGGGGGTPAELVRNDLRYRDLPRGLRERLESGPARYDFRVEFRATIGVNGRLTNCRVMRSGGDAELDAATCFLALRDIRFRPARDEAGRKVPDDGATFEQRWTVDRYEPDDPAPR